MFLSNNCVSKWKLIIGKDQLYVRQHYKTFQLEVICKFCYFIQLRVLISSVPFCYGFPFKAENRMKSSILKAGFPVMAENTRRRFLQ